MNIEHSTTSEHFDFLSIFHKQNAAKWNRIPFGFDAKYDRN